MPTVTFQFWATFKEAYTTLLDNKDQWIKIACGPWIITILAAVISLLFFQPADLADNPEAEVSWAIIIGNFAMMLIMVAASFMFSIRALRFRLLGEVPADYVSFEWNIRHWKYLLFTFIIMLLIAVPAGLATAFVTPLLGLGIFIVSLYFASRFALITPIIAVDAGNPLTGSWALTGGWTWLKILGLIILAVIPATIVLNIIGWGLGTVTHYTLSDLFNQLVTSYVVGAITNTALASAYKKLS